MWAMGFEWLGRQMYRRRWVVIALWTLIVLASAPFAPRLHDVLKPGGFANGVSEADRAVTLLQNDLHWYASTLTIIYTSNGPTIADPRFKSAVLASLAPLRRLPHLARVETYWTPYSTTADRMVAAGGRRTYVVLSFDTPFDRVQAFLPDVRRLLQGHSLATILTGDPVIYDDMERVSTEDLKTVEKFTFPVALVLLVLIFGTLVASAIPVALGGVSVVTTLAVLWVIAQHIEMSIFVLNVTTMIGLGIGIDYSLFVVNRFREEVTRRPLEDAVAVTVATAGRAVVFSGFTVMIGLMGLFVFKATALRSLGLGGSLVVAISVLAALTLLPALLGVLGMRINALAVVPQRVQGAGRFWPALAAQVMRRPWPIIAGALLLVAVLAAPARDLRLSIPDATILPSSVASRQGYDIMVNQFHSTTDAPIMVVVHAHDPILAPRPIDALYGYTRALARLGGVASLQSIVNLQPWLTRADYQQLPVEVANPGVAARVNALTGTRATLVIVNPRPGLTDDQANALVGQIRRVPLGGGLAREVGGFAAGKLDYITLLYKEFPLSVLFVVLATYLVLLVLFRSLLLPLKAVLMNMLSLAGSFGAVVFIFQQGHFSHILNFSPTGFVDEITPILMFCTLFGLSMDYEVFLLSRIKEHYDATGDNAAAVAVGISRTGRIITSAALIMVAVAGSFAFTGIILVKALGLGMAIAILLDATVIRSLLVPATMRVLGDWNWWMPWSAFRSTARAAPWSSAPSAARPAVSAAATTFPGPPQSGNAPG